MYTTIYRWEREIYTILLQKGKYILQSYTGKTFKKITNYSTLKADKAKFYSTLYACFSEKKIYDGLVNLKKI